MLTLDVLPASFGDSLVITYGRPGHEHRVVIDGGFGATGDLLTRMITAHDRPIDLLVVTHVDQDHIAGIVKLLKFDEVAARIDRIWFNGYKHLDEFSDMLGPVAGERLTTRLHEIRRPWNEGWPWSDPDDNDAPDYMGGPVVVTGDRPVRRRLPAGAELIVLSPSPGKLNDLAPKWEKAVRAAGLTPGAEPEPDEPHEDEDSDMLGASLDDLADEPFDEDDTEANGASIAFVFQYRDEGRTHRILLAGDAHPDLLVAGIDKLRRSRDRYPLDACKLPHHGSRRNVTREFVRLIDCRNWIVSTSGAQYHHPHQQTLARLIVDGPPDPTIIGNYPSDELADFESEYPPDLNGYRLRRPEAGAEGIRLRFTPDGVDIE